MKTLLRFSILVSLLVLILISCDQDNEPVVDLNATVRAAVEATLAAQPTDTPAPDLRATVLSAVDATMTAQPTSTPEPMLSSYSDQERLYRSYPEPTGLAGFRLYYQKRCYPGCHGTPQPDGVHP